MGAYVFAPHGATYHNVYPGKKVGQAKPVHKAPFVKSPLEPASEKQVGFIRTLLSERQVAGSLAHDMKVSIESNTLTKGAASEAISVLLDSPKRDKSGDHKVVAQPAVKPVPGFYTDNETFFEVIESKAGKHYAKKFEVGSKSGKWVYAPGAIKSYADWTKVSLSDAADFGLAHGYCFACGRLLTNPESVAKGIGPICANKF